MAGRFVAFLLAAALSANAGRAEEVAALYRASWAGLPAGEIRLVLRDDPAAYRGEIAIRTEGLAYLATRFRATGVSEGRLAAAGPPAPSRYDALYDLRKRRDKRLSMQFRAQGGASIAERGATDTSTRPPLAENFRTGVLDPLSALAAIRQELRRGTRGTFTLPVYDGARRFDVIARVLPKRGADTVLRLELTLAPIAGFKGETSDDGDPDTARRIVTLAISDDCQLLPLEMSVSLYYLPLVVALAHPCAASAPCGWE